MPPRKAPLYMVRIAAGYTYGDQEVDQGQVVELLGARNDEKLVRLGYLVEVEEKNPTVLECGECGANFLNEAGRTAHGRKRHPRRSRPMEMSAVGAVNPRTGEPSAFADTDGDREDRRMWEENPPYLEKTQASQTG